MTHWVCEMVLFFTRTGNALDLFGSFSCAEMLVRKSACVSGALVVNTPWPASELTACALQRFVLSGDVDPEMLHLSVYADVLRGWR
jgi:hypothetical protein